MGAVSSEMSGARGMRFRDYVITFGLIPLAAAAVVVVLQYRHADANEPPYVVAALLAAVWVYRRKHSVRWGCATVVAAGLAVFVWYVVIMLVWFLYALSQCAPNAYECPI